MSTLVTPWTLDFDRDGTEDVAIIRDAEGETLATSRPFWKPEEGDPASPTLEAMRVMAAAPKLLAALQALLPYAEAEAFSLERHKDSPEAIEEASRAWDVVKAGQDAIAEATGRAA